MRQQIHSLRVAGIVAIIETIERLLILEVRGKSDHHVSEDYEWDFDPGLSKSHCSCIRGLCAPSLLIFQFLLTEFKHDCCNIG